MRYTIILKITPNAIANIFLTSLNFKLKYTYTFLPRVFLCLFIVSVITNIAIIAGISLLRSWLNECFLHMHKHRFELTFALGRLEIMQFMRYLILFLINCRKNPYLTCRCTARR